MRLNFFVVLALALPVAGMPAMAQTSAIGGPVVGYVFESAQSSVRPILGVPGASLLGGSAQLGFAAATAALSPRQNYLLAVDAADGSIALVDLGGAALSRRAIDGAWPGASRIVLSPNGASAALLYADNTVQILKGLPARPEVAGTLQLANLPGAAGALAVSDDAGVVLAASAGGLFAVVPGADPQPLPFTGDAALVVFTNGTRDALVAGADNQVALVGDVTGQPGYRLLAGPADGIDQPVGLAASADNRQVLVANAGSGAIAILNTAGGVANSLACSCQVTGLARMNGAAVYRVSDLSDAPLWILDAGGSEALLLFVPARVSEEAAQ